MGFVVDLEVEVVFILVEAFEDAGFVFREEFRFFAADLVGVDFEAELVLHL